MGRSTTDSAQSATTQKDTGAGTDAANTDAGAGTTSGATTGAATGNDAADVTYTAEQQAHIDKIVGERLAKVQAKWQADQEAKAKAANEAAEAEQQKAKGEWETLAHKHEGKVTELEGKLTEATTQLERANAVIAGLVENRKKGLPPAMLKALEGRDPYDQLQLADAYWSSQPANGQRAAATTPTPPAQTAGAANYAKQAIERQNKKAVENDPYAAMMK